MPKFKFALVSWANGPDKDKTSIIRISWLIDFDPAATTDTTSLVECRTTNSKKPVNGWPVEDAVVFSVAGKSVLHTLSYLIYLFFSYQLA